MKDLTYPSPQQKTLFCLLCLFWNCRFAQSSVNSSSVERTTIPEPSYFQEPSAEDLLIPFEEECVAQVVYINGGEGPRTKLKCALADGLTYSIPSLDEKWIKEQIVLGELVSAETIMALPDDAMLNKKTYEIHMTGLPMLWNYEMEERERRRNLRRLQTTGAKTVLVVRVTSSDSKTTTPTAADLGTYVFGDNSNTLNLKVQTEACSYNQVTINKATARTGTSASISNGVTSITVTTATTAGADAMEVAITSELKSQFGVTLVSELADHVMYCFPPGTTTSLAYAYVNGYLSFYNDVGCTYASAQIHEIGHNYNMGHSSDSANAYGDQTGLMGYSYESTTFGYMCFNAAKSWQLGWYSSKHVSFSPSSTSATLSTTLAGIIDYSTTASTNMVLLEIQQSSSTLTTYYYIGYNRVGDTSTSINRDTQECKDQVSVLSKDTSDISNVSMVQSYLSVGGVHTISNFNGQSGETLTITFTSVTSTNEAVVDVVLSGFAATPTVSAFPSQQPSNAPSATGSVSTKPSLTPSSSPSTIPSNQPSTSPSLSPSAIPSGAPSFLPSLAPSQNPSLSSAPSVSMQPSSRPSKSDAPSTSSAPSQQPSGVPSVIPSNQPSSNPSLSPSARVTVSIQPSKIPTTSPSVSPSNSFLPTDLKPSSAPSQVPSKSPSKSPSLSYAPSAKPVTPAPTDPISVQRTGTVVIEMGIAGLNNLDKICTAIEGYLGQGIQKGFNTNTQTTIVCTRGIGRRRVLFKDLYEKPILITVTTTFADVRQAPRQFSFVDFLENLIVSQDAQNNLPQYIQQALGTSEGVHISLIQTTNKPIMIVSFGDQAPTASPTTGPPSVTAPTTGTQTSAAARQLYYKSGSYYLLSLAAAVAGIAVLL